MGASFRSWEEPPHCALTGASFRSWRSGGRLTEPASIGPPVLTLVLADAELERVPEAIADHPQVAKPADRKETEATRMLLDASRHHHAMRAAELKERRRRGRADLMHLFLLTALDSALNLEGGLNTLVHTRHHELIEVAPETRIMRAYPRFKGLIETLFEEGEVGPADRDPLLTLTRRKPLPAILKGLDPDHTIVLDPAGEDVEPADEIPCLAGEHDHVAVVLGGFPHGDYASPVDRVADAQWSIHDERLSVWTAASEILVHWRHLTQGISVHRGPPPDR